MAVSCTAFNSYLFRRVPDFDRALAKDRQPFSYLYSGMYNTQKWPSFTGTTHTFDKVHVTRPNDLGNWPAMNADSCLDNSPCSPTRLYTGWGSTRNTYTKYHQDYQSPVFCFDQIRNVEEAEAQLSAIIAGHQKLPESIISDFLRFLALRQSDYLWLCGAADGNIATTAGLFVNGGLDIALGSTALLPTSKLSMGYLDNHVERLMYNGYFEQEFLPQGKFTITTDIQTQRDLTNGNPALAAMYNAADFVKGGKMYAYGAMSGAGNWLFKVDPEPMRFQHIGGGTLRRVWPFQNVAATIGLKPVYDPAYTKAEYQLYHVHARAAREVYVGDLTSVNPKMQFGLARSLMGKWSWKNPDYFTARDPNTGTVCSYNNDKKNMGYFLGEFEMGIKTVYPEIEMMIIAKREPQPVVDVPRCATANTMVYQSLTPYNTLCTGF